MLFSRYCQKTRKDIGPDRVCIYPLLNMLLLKQHKKTLQIYINLLFHLVTLISPLYNETIKYTASYNLSGATDTQKLCKIVFKFQ